MRITGHLEISVGAGPSHIMSRENKGNVNQSLCLLNKGTLPQTGNLDLTIDKE